MKHALLRLPCLILILALPAGADEAAAPDIPSAPDIPAAASADAVLRALDEEGLRDLAAEVLQRNPAIARARARAAAAEARAPQVASLPDPMATMNLFVLPPETRVGPQRLSLMVSQRLPWFGKLELRERAALLEATAARADVEAERLRILTEAHRLFHEIVFQDEYAKITDQEHAHLVRHEEVSRTRYGAGMGLQQQVVRVQAEITRNERRALQIQVRRLELQAALNALRDRPAETPLHVVTLPRPRAMTLDPETLRQRARRRPEVAAARARITAAQARVELAEKEFRPDLQLGLSYTLVERRRDDAGRLNPPQGNGDDVLAFSAGANLPVRRRKREAALQEALHRRSAEEEGLRAVLAGIDSRIGDLASRLPLLHQQWELLDTVLKAQAEEALRSAEAAYATGKLSALDLLDAEHVLFDVRTSAARTHADWAIARAQLEGAVGGPVAPLSSPEDKNDDEEVSP